MWRSQCIEEDDRHYVHTYILIDQAELDNEHLHWKLFIHFLLTFSYYKLFSSHAGQMERSPSIIVPDIWITLSLSHQISHYIQMTRPAARDMKEGRRM